MSRIGMAFAAIALAALVSGCGDTPHEPTGPHSAPSDARSTHNEQDLTFATDMIAHHTQAIDMAKLVPSRSTDPKMLKLAGSVEQAQTPEIEKMREWLSEWGAPTAGHGEAHPSMPGMMTSEELDALRALTGADFDRRWLEMMIRHHQGAIDMAEVELEMGHSDVAKALAQQIIDSQRAEMTQMQELLQA
ncbi:Uncharacterized conserved protein, DUF305 family [Actinokineospora alba]|uniref:Uncharacterized conserved protein, DUF305 family n=1 Tax=Actinokineospora alba TaxID=504798 RepID=A0A1H0H9C0_9PSEU|nr:DUF305 domain-containing protein [Actinokineospora alba]TDP64979.1 uncharacterized protein (DUF305 family) [Actinokineospora alba]SDH50955.1 Uncharacterized conserved protein, DUF305 family [Actinokineospora alba]SDO15742.1 Uncharacterized conserved protein, DUF305 family [Actinokineospora alba]